MPEQPIESHQIEQDIRLMVSGKFAPDHIGPDEYKAVSKRALSNAAIYLDLCETLYFGPNFDAISHSNLRLPALLNFFADVEPVRVRELANQLLRQYNAVLVVYDSATDKNTLSQILPMEMMNLSIRLDRQREGLRRLIG